MHPVSYSILVQFCLTSGVTVGVVHLSCNSPSKAIAAPARITAAAFVFMMGLYAGNGISSIISVGF